MTNQARGDLAETFINLPGMNRCNAPGPSALDSRGRLWWYAVTTQQVCVCTLG